METYSIACIILFLASFFIGALSLVFELLQISRDIQDFSQYSDWSQQNDVLDGLDSSSDF